MYNRQQQRAYSVLNTRSVLNQRLKPPTCCTLCPCATSVDVTLNHHFGYGPSSGFQWLNHCNRLHEPDQRKNKQPNKNNKRNGHVAAGKGELAQLLDFDIYPTEDQQQKHH